MKAMILAAGRGTRMWPLSLLRAKPALPVLNRPLLQHTLELLKRHGVREVIVNLHHLPRTVTEALAPVAGLKITYSRERQLLGTGGGPRKVADAFGDAPFLLVNGDMVCDFDLSVLLAHHQQAGGLATMALLPNPDPRYYAPVVTDPRGWVVSLPGSSKKKRGRVSLFAGIHVVEPRLLRILRRGPSDIVRDLYAPLIGAGGQILGVRMEGSWWDFGTPRLYLEAQRAMLRRIRWRGLGVHPTARVHPGSVVRSSVLGAGVTIAEGARVVGSVLWPGTQVEAGAWVRGAILAGGVLGAGERAAEIVRWPSGWRMREAAL